MIGNWPRSFGLILSTSSQHQHFQRGNQHQHKLQSSVQHRALQTAITPRRATFRKLFTPRQTDADSRLAKLTTVNHGRITKHNTGFKRFPFNNFTYYLTLFSKFFSSFPHGTCSLSVSRQYLALDGIYHPFWSAFPNKPTLRKRII